MTAPSVIIDLPQRTVVTADGRGIPLSWAEFSLVAELIAAQGAIRSREELSQAVLRRAWEYRDRGVDQVVFQLRRKLPRDADGSWMVRSVRGVGYWMRAVRQDDAASDRWVAA